MRKHKQATKKRTMHTSRGQLVSFHPLHQVGSRPQEGSFTLHFTSLYPCVRWSSHVLSTVQNSALILVRNRNQEESSGCLGHRRVRRVEQNLLSQYQKILNFSYHFGKSLTFPLQPFWPSLGSLSCPLSTTD